MQKVLLNVENNVASYHLCEKSQILAKNTAKKHIFFNSDIGSKTNRSKRLRGTNLFKIALLKLKAQLEYLLFLAQKFKEKILFRMSCFTVW